MHAAIDRTAVRRHDSWLSMRFDARQVGTDTIDLRILVVVYVGQAPGRR